MGRTNIKVITQPNDVTCGPASLKHALEILGVKKSVSALQRLCKTTRNGTSTKKMICAIQKLGYAVVAVNKANPRHIMSALHSDPSKPRAAIVDYLYGADEEVSESESGHWAAISSFSPSKKRIVVMDSYTGKRKSYTWKIFRSMWKDFDRIRKPNTKLSGQYKLVRKWQKRLLLIIAKQPSHLPAFRLNTITV